MARWPTLRPRALDRIDEELRLSREQHREAMAEYRRLAEEHDAAMAEHRRFAEKQGETMAEGRAFMARLERERRAHVERMDREWREYTERVDRERCEYTERMDRERREYSERMDRERREYTERVDRDWREFAEQMEARHAKQVAESHEFMREITREVRAIGNDQTRALRALTKTVLDLRDESRAQREALLRMIDRLGPSPGGATA